MGRKRMDTPTKRLDPYFDGEANGSARSPVITEPPPSPRRSGTMRRLSPADVATPASTPPAWDDEPDTKRFVTGLAGGRVSELRPMERRGARRVRLEVPVVLRLDEEVIEGTSEDISASGIFVKTSRLLRAGKRVQLQFDLPQGVLEVNAVIVRFRTPAKGVSPGVGLCFQAMSGEQQETIEAFCESSPDSVR